MQLTREIVREHRNTHTPLTMKKWCTQYSEDRWKIWPWNLESLALALGPKSLALWCKSLALALWLKSLALALGSESLALALRPKSLLTSLPVILNYRNLLNYIVRYTWYLYDFNQHSGILATYQQATCNWITLTDTPGTCTTLITSPLLTTELTSAWTFTHSCYYSCSFATMNSLN